jgi:hypothetical protein
MAYNNLQILNFNHNIVSLSNGNTLVITDNIKGNSISIPEPITHILQINSPGPQGPQGPSGSGGGGGNIDTGSFATTGSNTFRGNQVITGSITFNEGARITSTYYGNTYPGYIDIVAGAKDGFVELLSYDASSSFFIDDYGAYINTNSSSLFNLWEFKNDGRLLAPRGIEAPSFTGSLQSTSVKISGSLIITGSSTTNINSGAFTVTSPSISFLYMTSSGYFKIGSPDADYGIDMDLSGVGQMRLINGNQITTYAPIVKFGLDGNPVVVEITGSFVATNETTSFSLQNDNIIKSSYNGSDIGLKLNFVQNEYWIGTGPTLGQGTLFFDAYSGSINTYFNIENKNKTGLYADANIAVLGDFSGYSGNWMAVKTDQGNKQASIGTYSSDVGNGTRLVVDDRDGIKKVIITGSLDVEGSVNIANGNLGLQYKFVDLTSTGNYIIADNSAAIVYRFSNASSTTYNVEIPPASTCLNRIYWISRSNDGTVIGAVTLQCSSNIEDNAGNFNVSFNIEENQKYQWISDGTQWIMISG